MKLLKLTLLAAVSVGALAISTHVQAASPQDQAAAANPPSWFNRASPDMQRVLMALDSLHGKPIETLKAPEARQQPTPTDAVHKVLREEGLSPQKVAQALNVETKDITYPIDGGVQPARIYRPIGSANKILPVIVYYHGGGFVIANINTYDSSPRALAHLANAVVVSVEYRHAPEHKFPAQQEDAFAAYKYVLANAASWNADPHNVAVAGESAGGNLAANVAIMARDQNVQPPVAMALVYPVAQTSVNTPSYEQNAYVKPLNKGMMLWFVKNTISRDKQKQDPRLDLVHADLHNLPPATIITADIDPLRSDGQELAQALHRAGDRVDYKNYMGVTHEFFGMAPVVKASLAAQKQVANNLDDAFNARQR